MTDLEITRLCAEAIGYAVVETSQGLRARDGEYDFMVLGSDGGPYLRRFNPLHDDAQAMALVKKFWLDIEVFIGTKEPLLCWGVVGAQKGAHRVKNTDLNRAICECVAKMQKAKA